MYRAWAICSPCYAVAFQFASCKESQKVLIFELLTHEVNSKFHVNRHCSCEALCIVLSRVTLQNNFAAVKTNEAVERGQI